MIGVHESQSMKGVHESQSIVNVLHKSQSATVFYESQCMMGLHEGHYTRENFKGIGRKGIQKSGSEPTKSVTLQQHRIFHY